MDWRDWIVFEQITTEPYWLDIIQGHVVSYGFYNIKILKKEGKYMQAYLDFLAMLQGEYATLETTDINALVEKRVAKFRIEVTAEEETKLATAKANKQAEIDAVNRIIERLQEATVEETNKNVEY